MNIPLPPKGSGCFVPPDRTTRKVDTLPRPDTVLRLWAELDKPEDSKEFRTALWVSLGSCSVNRTLRAWLDEHA